MLLSPGGNIYADLQSSPVRIASLTSIRLFAALLVVIYHFGLSVWPFDSGFLHRVTQCAASAVAFFFFLSGFILAHVYHGAEWSEPGVWRKYIVARLARIYPIYAVALMAQFLLGLGHVYLDRLSIVDQLVTLQIHAGLMQAWLPDSVVKLNVPGWSLSVEAGFYLLFPWIVQRIMALKQRAVAPTFAVLFLVSQGMYFWMRAVLWPDWFYASQTIHNVLMYHPVIYYPVFIMGVLTFRLVQSANSSRPSAPRLMALLSLASILGIAFFSYWANDVMTYTIHVGMLSPLYGVLIYSLCEARNGVSRLLSARWLSELGEASYSVYILQMPMHSLMVRCFPSLGGAAFFYLYVMALIGVSYALFRRYETPVRKWIRQTWGTGSASGVRRGTT